MAERAVLKTSNAPITGHYDTSHELELETSNAAILVDVDMFSDGRGSSLLLKTSNGYVSCSSTFDFCLQTKILAKLTPVLDCTTQPRTPWATST